MKKITFILLFIGICTIGFSQNQTLIDSLNYQLAHERQDTNRVAILLKLHSTFWDSPYPDSSNVFSEKALDLASKINYPKGEFEALSRLMTYHRMKGDSPKALSYGHKAMQIAEEMKDHSIKGTILDQLALLYILNLRDYQKAESYLKQSIQEYETLRDIDRVADLEAKLSSLYRRSHQFDSMLIYQKRAYVKYERLNKLDSSGLFIMILGANHAEIGNYALALPLLKKSIVVNNKVKNYYQEVSCLQSIATVYKKMNQLDSAIYYEKKAIEVATRYDYKQFLIISYKNLADIYEAKDKDTAFQYQKMAWDLNESVNGTKKIIDLEKTIVEEKERQQKEDIEKIDRENRLKQYALLAGLGFMFLIGFMLYRNNRQKRKANQVLENTLTDLKTSQTQLEFKNRDLEIEAALERVRSRAMAMHKSDELGEASELLYKELQNLGITDFVNCGYVEIDEQKMDTYGWMTNSEGQAMERFYIPLVGEPVLQSRYEAWKRQDSVFCQTVGNEMLKEHLKFTLPQLGSEEVVQHAINSFPDPTIFYCGNFSHGYLCIITGTPLTSEKEALLARFTKVFELTYKRFLDLQKAETQTREAQIELALERVRSRTMAMHHSNELTETAAILFQQLKDLGLEFWACGFCVWRTDDPSLMQNWSSGGTTGGFLSPMMLPFKEDPGHRNIYEASLRGELFVEQRFEGEELKKHYDWIMSQPSAKVVFDQLEEVGITPPPVQYKYAALFKQGYLLMISEEPKPNTPEIAQRFAKVFEQTYTRFLDLQKAEAQTREAQIEAALERVRSRALAMQNSNELIEIANVMREQMGLLGQPELETTAVHLYTEGADSFDSWYAFRDGNQATGKVFTGSTRFKIDSCELIREMLASYYFDVKDYTLEASGSKLEEFAKVLMAAIPDIKASPPKAYHHFSDFSGGSLLMVSYQPPSEESKYLIKKCASVFDLAYRRYLDLKQAEAQTEQARLNLIQIQTEKKKAEDALTQLKTTQTQLIQSEKLASLGELTAGIAHEIQNPLNFVNNFSELSVDLVKDLKDELKRPDKDETYIDELFDDLTSNQEKINHHGKRASSIVKGMLEHSRASTGVKELTDINKLADEYLRLSYQGLRAKDKDFNADFKTEFDENLPKMEVIPQDIGRVLLNLINNAFYAVNQRKQLGSSSKLEPSYTPSVSITTQQIYSQIIIKVKDNGIGMSEAIKAKVFQPFFTTKPTGQGTGLGLSLTYDIVTKGHGGTLEVVSTEGVGSEFIVTLPFKTIDS